MANVVAATQNISLLTTDELVYKFCTVLLILLVVRSFVIYILRVCNLRRIRWKEHVAEMGYMRIPKGREGAAERIIVSWIIRTPCVWAGL
jgi:hypothetical protein